MRGNDGSGRRRRPQLCRVRFRLQLQRPTGATEWAYYTPTPNALAELTLQIPSGFTEVPFPASTSPNDAWCRVHQTCLTYPQTLPLPASTTATSVPAAVTTVPTATTTVPAPTGGAA